MNISPTAQAGMVKVPVDIPPEVAAKMAEADTSAETAKIVRPPTIQISRRYYIHPQVNVLIEHV